MLLFLVTLEVAYVWVQYMLFEKKLFKEFQNFKIDFILTSLYIGVVNKLLMFSCLLISGVLLTLKLGFKVQQSLKIIKFHFYWEICKTIFFNALQHTNIYFKFFFDYISNMWLMGTKISIISFQSNLISYFFELRCCQ